MVLISTVLHSLPLLPNKPRYHEQILCFLWRSGEEELKIGRYGEETSHCIYGSEINLLSESVNSAICTSSNSYAPCCCCSLELTSYFNDHSYLRRTGTVSCFLLQRTPSIEDANCFFTGSSCSGTYPVSLDSTTTNCVLTKFNLANNTDPAGTSISDMGTTRESRSR